jgi:hypothetical protein
VNEDIGQFRGEFRVYLSMISPIFDRLSALIDESATSVGPELEEQVDEIEKVIEQTRDQATAACHVFVRLIYEERIETRAKSSDRKINGPASRLDARAHRRERYATTAVEIAVLAMEEAERAVLRALLARQEACLIQVHRFGTNLPDLSVSPDDDCHRLDELESLT